MELLEKSIKKGLIKGSKWFVQLVVWGVLIVGYASALVYTFYKGKFLFFLLIVFVGMVGIAIWDEYSTEKRKLEKW